MSGRRQARGMLRYDDTEWAVISMVAARAGLRPGAWAQQAAYTAALRANGAARQVEHRAVLALLAELRQHRRVLTNVGGNLNDLARAANSTGAIEHASTAQAIMRLIGNVVRASDTLVKDIRARALP